VVMEITAAPTQNKQQLKLKSRKAAIGGWGYYVTMKENQIIKLLLNIWSFRAAKNHNTASIIPTPSDS
jgi:hypothetical protein